MALSAIQDYYVPPYRHCFGCGPDHADGWQIKSYWQDDGEIAANFLPPPRFTGGVPQFLYGGLLAAVLDCHGTAAAAAYYHQAQGFELGHEPLGRCVTASLTVNYRQPTPTGKMLNLRARLMGIEGRKVSIALSVHAEGELCCDGNMLAIRVREEQN